MSAWLPVVAGLAGAMVGGAISVLVTWLNAHAEFRMNTFKLAEERAIWAANRRLTQLQTFYGAVEKLGVAAQNHRVWWAWHVEEAKGKSVASWVQELGDTRGAFEHAMRAAQLDVSLIDDDLLSGYVEISDIYLKQVMISEDPVSGMVAIERSVEQYRKRIAERYRAATAARLSGADVAV